jgi:hypothetical protein
MYFPIMDINQTDLAAEVESYEAGTITDESGQERRLAWAELFPLKYTSRFDIKSLSGKEGIPISADKIAFNVKAPTKTRRTVGAWSGELSKIAISRSKNEIDINEYKDKKAAAAASSYDRDAKEELVEIVFDDVRFCDTGMNTKIEVDAMRAASHGFLDFPAEIDGDNATSDTVNFNIPSENQVGASVVWSDAANADGIGDIEALVKTFRHPAKGKAKKAKPRFVFMEVAAFELLCAQTKTMSRLSAFSLFNNQNIVLTPDMVNVDTINRYMRNKQLPQIILLDTEAGIEDAAGNVTPIKPWAENVVVLAPTRQLGRTYYKTVPDVENTEALQTHSSFYKMTRYSDVNPMEEVTLAEAYVFPVLENRNSLGYINTAKTTWSNGSAQ